MINLFKRAAKEAAFDAAGLGTHVVALPAPSGCAVPQGCSAVVVCAGGHTRRVEAGGRIKLCEGDRAYCFHPGPYSADLAPFEAAPEVGLRLSFAVDSADPRLAQQRFDLYLASECQGPLALDELARRIEEALQRELAQGNLELPPCTTLEEWNAFRAGFNQLVYARFGLCVDDCIPVDLSSSRNYASMLLERTVGWAPEPTPLDAETTRGLESQPCKPGAPFDAPASDKAALRRLFLELPSLMTGLRLAVLPADASLFRQQQTLMQRLDLVSLSVTTMPALELSAPGEPLAAIEQIRRARHSQRAASTLDDAWALLARFEPAQADDLPMLFDELDRLVANLEHHCSGRRAVGAGEEP
jgi:hypothetical protein